MDGDLEVPLHRSLVTPMLLAGIPRSACLVLWTLVASMALGARQYWVVPIGIVVHIAAASMAKKDPWFFDVAMRSLKTGNRRFDV